MHSYLRSIGFSEIKNKNQMDLLLKDAIHHPTARIMTTISSETSLVQISKDYGHGIGISLIGELDKKGVLNVEHYFPYLVGEHTTKEESIHIEKHSHNESYAGVCDDINVGVSLIFYLNNIADYNRRKWLNQYAKDPTAVKLSGLCTSGKIILDINETFTEKKKNKGSIKNRNQLLAAAKSGDVEAMENLTLDDMDTYTIISKRTKSEDLYSIVKSYFMPYGIETELYSILGTITNVNITENTLSKQEIYNLTIDINNIIINVGISKNDLEGVPEIGRRFKGNIWLQGIVNL